MVWGEAKVCPLGWFRDLSLSHLLEGVEACSRKEKVWRFVKSWEDEERKFRMGSCVNEVGRFILCSFLVEKQKCFV